MAEASLGEDLAIMAETGLTLPQVLTLFRLHDHSPQCVSSIAAVLHLSQPATSQLLDRLVHEGLVDRAEDRGIAAARDWPSPREAPDSSTRLADAKSRGLDHAANSLSPQVRERLASVLQEALHQLDRGSEGAADPQTRKERARHGRH